MPRVLENMATLTIWDEVGRARVKKHYGLPRVLCYQCQKLIRLGSWVAFKKVNTMHKIELFTANGSRKYPRVYHLKCFTRLWH